MVRANIITRTAPTAPVYICLDAGLQEAELDKEPEWPDLARFMPPAPARPAKERVEQAAALLQGAQKPVMLFGPRLARRQRLAAAHRARRAARRLRADRSQARRDVPDRPSARIPAEPFNVLRQAGARAPVRSRRHPGARLDRSRRRAAAGQGRRQGHGARSIHASLDQTCTTASTWTTRGCRRPTCRWRRGRRGGRGTARGARRRPQGAVEGARPAKNKSDRRHVITLNRSPRRCARRSTIPRTSASPRSAAAGRSTSGRSGTALLSGQGRRRRHRLRPRHLGRRRARAAGQRQLRGLDPRRRRLPAWARPRSGPRCATASRCWS